tara:strand:+ start:713 stop:937 length:225 start_codon:yes stop_codon:yes gene_type:complete
MSRPPDIIANDDDHIRSDLDSECVRNVYQNLPVEKTWKNHCEYVKLRKEYLRENDIKAYQLIKNKFPKFTPPEN